jgi:hypothetical protein
MPPNQETIRFEDLKAFPIKTKQQFWSQVNSLTFTLFIILILFLKKSLYNCDSIKSSCCDSKVKGILRLFHMLIKPT